MPAVPPTPQSTPNVLIFFADDQRFDTIRALGNPAIHTPNIDRLVQRGTTFTHAHIPCGTHGAICMPSRAMLHTGRTLFHLHDSGSSIPPSTPCSAKRCARTATTLGAQANGTTAGSRSIAASRTATRSTSAAWPTIGTCRRITTTQAACTTSACRTSPIRHRSATTTSHGATATTFTPGGHSSEVLSDAVIDYLGRQDGSKPFFAYVALLAPHDPRTMPQQFLEMYPCDEVALPPNFLGGHPFDNGALRIRDELLAHFPRTPEEIRRHIAEYYAMITPLGPRVRACADGVGRQRAGRQHAGCLRRRTTA